MKVETILKELAQSLGKITSVDIDEIRMKRKEDNTFDVSFHIQPAHVWTMHLPSSEKWIEKNGHWSHLVNYGTNSITPESKVVIINADRSPALSAMTVEWGYGYIEFITTCPTAIDVDLAITF